MVKGGKPFEGCIGCGVASWASTCSLAHLYKLRTTDCRLGHPRHEPNLGVQPWLRTVLGSGFPRFPRFPRFQDQDARTQTHRTSSANASALGHPGNTLVFPVVATVPMSRVACDSQPANVTRQKPQPNLAPHSACQHYRQTKFAVMSTA